LKPITGLQAICSPVFVALSRTTMPVPVDNRRIEFQNGATFLFPDLTSPTQEHFVA
jgi:hypothetical protein